jgi:PHD/YefM family antitoxin component YafN of YafNO toxin-antitoxin module
MIFAINLQDTMINLEDIHSLSDFQRNTKEHISRLKESGKPTVLTVNGKAEVVVLSASSFQALADQVERAEAIEGIQRGLEEAKAGKGRPVREAMESIRAKHRIAKAN